MRLLIVGIPQPTHVGLHLLNAARQLGHDAEVMDVTAASAGPVWWRRVCWHLSGHRAPRMRQFSRAVWERCLSVKPDWVLVTGLAPLNEATLRKMDEAGIPVANFLTDDPWNRQHRAPWFMRALPRYRHVFTPRHANEDDLRAHGVKSVSYLPFAYAPEDHHPPEDLTEEDLQRWGGLVAFIGGADADRVACAHALHEAGVPLGLWGGYWKKYPELARHAHGHADAATCRRIVAAAGANLCLVRRANRDGHSMRSYELPAIGACLLVEDTEDHRRLFGEDGEAVRYFMDMTSMTSQARVLLALPVQERFRMAAEAHQRVIRSGGTYACRLETMMQNLFGHEQKRLITPA